jgi:hypothetical protein
MNIMNAILGAQDGQAVGALSQQFGLSQDQTVSALGARCFRRWPAASSATCRARAASSS